ncbi:MAG: ABC transporter ATP-binding protein [Pseudomonadota bacterium]
MSSPASTPFYTGAVTTAFRIMGERSRAMYLGIALRFVQAMCAGAPVGLLVWVVNRIRENTLTTDDAWLAAGVTLVAVALQYVVWYFSNKVTWTNTYYAIGEARARALAHVQQLSLGSMRTRSTGDMTSVFSTDFNAVSTFISQALPALFGAVGLPMVVLVIMLFLDPPLALSVALSLLVGWPLFVWTNRRFKALALLRGDRLADASGRMLEYVQGIAVARTFNQSSDRLSRFEQAVADIRTVNSKLVLVLLPLGMLTIGVIQLGTPVAMAFITYRWLGGAVDIGTALIFLVLVLRVYGPIVALAPEIENLRIGDAALERIGRVMDLAPQDAPEMPVAEPHGHDVEFHEVNFAYGEQPVLKDVSFVARAGTTTAIVGPSGAGKSTILHLGARFWDVRSGQITIGGVDVKDLTAEQLFDEITIVFQEVYLFQASIRENIAFGRPEASQSDIEAAARAAQAHEFINDLPDQYGTMVGEGGATLSGGERQRISIARAILKNSPVVLLDEPTSSLDALNERAVRDALANLVRDKTVLVVAHRLPTIQAADQILVLESGRIVQQGRHETLIEEPGGRYRQIWQSRADALNWRIGHRKA